MPLTNAMTVDVEDYFQVSALESQFPVSQWSRVQLRVANNVDRILQLFDDYDTRGTFFVLGWLAERQPGMIRRISDAGHEIASHGYDHTRVTRQNRREFQNDVMSTKRLLEDVSGCEVIGYRAASYSVDSSNLWAFEVLAETGHRYSSSIYPITHDHYGMPDAPRFAFVPRGVNLTEIPVTTVSLLGRNWPCGGGGFFRLWPYPLYRWGLRRVNRKEGQPGVFYFHPWEIDPEQPRPRSITLKTRFRHYLNLRKTEGRLKSLLQDFRWDRLDRVFALR